MSKLSDFQLSEGVEVEELSGELYEKFCSQMKSFALGFIKLQPYNQMLPRCFLQYQKQIKEFQSRPDDVWVASFPKCGKIPNKHTLEVWNELKVMICNSEKFSCESRYI